MYHEKVEATRSPSTPWEPLRHPRAGSVARRPDVLAVPGHLDEDLPGLALLCGSCEDLSGHDGGLNEDKRRVGEIVGGVAQGRERSDR